MELAKKLAKSTELIDLLEGYLEQLMTLKGVRHAVMALESKDDSFKWSSARGSADQKGTAMEVRTPFWIASVTKLFIAAAILKLHEVKELAIDDLVINYFPENSLKGVHVLKGVDYYNKLTIKHLLSHSSGIPDYLEVRIKGQKNFIEQVLAEEDRAWDIDDILEIIRRAKQPLFPPQDLTNSKYKIRYSDTNFQLLIAILERVKQKTIADIFHNMIIKPLNLINTFHPNSEPLEPAPPTSTVWIEDVPFENKPQAIASFNDLNSTVTDLIKFMKALLNGKLFDNTETFKLMNGLYQTFVLGFSPLSPHWPLQYSLGMMRFKMPKLFSLKYSMPALIGHTGAVGSWLFYCSQLDLILAGTVSQTTAAAAPFRVLPKLLRELEKSYY